MNALWSDLEAGRMFSSVAFETCPPTRLRQSGDLDHRFCPL